MGSVDLVARQRQICPDLGVLVLDDGSADTAPEAIRCGAIGCVAQGAPTHGIVTHVHRVLVARERELRSAPPTQPVPVPEGAMAPAATIGEKVSLPRTHCPRSMSWSWASSPAAASASAAWQSRWSG